jgi:outer membrane protein, multidrug efflux system
LNRVAAIALLTLTGCSLAPSAEVPQPVEDLPETFLESEDTGEYAPLEWWRDFQDPTLDALIDSALVSNLGLAEAVARVELARAQSGIAWADLFPQLQAATDRSDISTPANTGIGGQFTEIPGDSAPAFPSFDRFDYTTYSASLGFSWELDFWGRARNDGRAAAADLMASRADLQAAQLGVLSETIATYFQIADLRSRVDLTRETVGVLEEREALTVTRYDRGLTSSLALYQVRLDLRTAQASLPQIEAQLADLEGQMAVLVGKYAGRIDDLLGDELNPTPVLDAIDTGLPADLLLQRPDVRAAAERLEAARFRVGARKAQLLPRLTLSGSAGQQSSDAGGLFDAGQWFTNFISGLTAPIFQGGRLRNNVKAAEAQYAQSAAAFGRTVLTAVYETETSLKRYDEERKRHAFLTSQREEAQASADLQARRYSTGVAGYTDYLDALRTLLGVQSNLSAANTELALARLAVHRALGGGWTDQSSQPVTSPAPTEASQRVPR